MNKKLLKERILGESADFTSYLQELISSERIDDETALGIAKYTIDNGPEELSDKQWYVLLEKGLGEYNYVDECERCSSTIPWSEMLGAVYIFEDSYCGYCSHLDRKND